MRQQMVGGIVALIIGLVPLGAMAQQTAFDPATRAAAEALAKQVAFQAAPRLSAPVAPARQGRLQPPPMATSEPTGEPGGEAVVPPQSELAELTAYTNQGVTIQAPTAWIVELGSDDEPVFTVKIPGTQITVSFEVGSALGFPSLLAVALLRAQAELIIAQYADEAQIDESATLYTSQGLPMSKLAISGIAEEVEEAGVFYVLAPNESAYVLSGAGPEEEWEQVAEEVQVIAESIIFDDDLITLTSVGDESMIFTSSDETVEVEVPAGWYVVDTNDPAFPIIMAEPEVRYVVTVSAEGTLGENFDAAALQELVPSEGELAPEDQEDLLAAVLEQMTGPGNGMTADEEQSAVFTREGAATVRMVGEADLGDGLAMPVVVYVDVHANATAVAVVFGEVASALGNEEELHSLVQSVTGP